MVRRGSAVQSRLWAKGYSGGVFMQIVTLECEVCGERFYTTNKTKEMVQQRVKFNLKKYCPRCRKHTAQKEVK
jgi:large subunit ribosomal protein L33